MIKLLDILNESQPIKNLTPEEINNIPYFYHATSYSNLDKIITEGLKVDKIEGVIYLTDDPKDALKFLYISSSSFCFSDYSCSRKSKAFPSRTFGFAKSCSFIILISFSSFISIITASNIIFNKGSDFNVISYIKKIAKV